MGIYGVGHELFRFCDGDDQISNDSFYRQSSMLPLANSIHPSLNEAQWAMYDVAKSELQAN